MDKAESQMNTQPDSALTVLSSIDKNRLGDDEGNTRYALLMSMALDKNYIDTTTFDVLQPAIDYYLENGDADEQLRTLYYQGRIYQNQGNDDSAMSCFMKAHELKNDIKDKLLLAHTLVATGSLDLKQYKIKQFIQNNIDAAKIYENIDKDIFAMKSYANALGGYVMLNDKVMADSIMSVCDKMLQENPDGIYCIRSAYISYITEYGSKEELNALLSEHNYDLSAEDLLDFAKGYSKLGDHDKAFEILSGIDTSGETLDSLKYLSIKTLICEHQGKYELALSLYKEYSALMERYQHELMSQDLLFAEERHHIEMKNLAEIQGRDHIIWMTLCGIFSLTLFIGWLYYRYRLIKSKRILTDKENENLRLGQENLRRGKKFAELERNQKILEADNLEKDKRRLEAEHRQQMLEYENLRREKEFAELERNQKILEADNLEKDKRRLEAEHRQQMLEYENLRLEKLQLETERDRLNDLLKAQSGLTHPLQKVIRMRLDMLNSIMAKDIANYDGYAKPYNKWIESIRKDKEEFMNSTRLAFRASHPKTMEYLSSHGLSIDEINYLCLYAIGLRGKDVGEYIKLKRHYNISSDIRKKLGLDEHEANIGPYIRKLMDKLDSQSW